MLGLLSEKLMDIETELRAGFDRMDSLMKELATELMENIRAVHMQACAARSAAIGDCAPLRSPSLPTLTDPSKHLPLSPHRYDSRATR